MSSGEKSRLMNKASERDSHRTSPRDDESGLYSIRSDVSEPTYKSGTQLVLSSVDSLFKNLIFTISNYLCRFLIKVALPTQ